MLFSPSGPNMASLAGSALACLHNICLRIAAAAAVAMAKKCVIDLRRVYCQHSAKGQEANTRRAMGDGL